MNRSPKIDSSNRDQQSWYWPAVGTLLVLYTLAAMLHVQTRLSLVELGYQLSQELSRQRQLQGQWRRMSIEAATLRHPRRIRAIATNELGMMDPSADQVLGSVSAPLGRRGPKGR